MPITPGTTAPDFELASSTGGKVALSSYRGDQAVALVFYPFTFSGVCEAELCGLRDDHTAFTDAGVQVLAVSCNATHAQKVWAEQQGFGYPVLSDFWPHGEVAQAYDVFDEARGCAVRATFLIDRDGTVVDVFDTPDLKTPRAAERYREALAKL